MLSKDAIRPAARGDPSLLVVTLSPIVSQSGEESEVFAIPIDFRRGGLLIALPDQSIAQRILQDGQQGSDDLLIGPNSIFQVSCR